MYQVSNARLLSYSLLPPTDPFNFTCLNQVICNSGCPLRQITPKTQWIQPLSALLISQKAAGDWTTNLLKSPRCHSERKTGKPCWVQIVNWFFSLVSRPNGNTKFQWSPLTTFTAIQLTVKQDSLHSFVGRGNSQDNTGTAVIQLTDKRANRTHYIALLVEVTAKIIPVLLWTVSINYE